MLRPGEDRLNYSDLLVPPTGYEVEFAVGTTYSLDLEALIGVPIALSLSEEMDGTLHDNPIYALEALRKSSEKFVIFCEAGQMQIPRNANTIFYMMENSVFEVALRNNKSFHPKLWLIKYSNKDGEELYRLIVLSRNLTFDRSWDISVCLEGKRTKRKTTKNKPLVDLIQFLIPYSEDKGKTKQIQGLLKELEYVHFNPNDKHIPSFDFCPLGMEGYDKDSTGIFESYHHLAIMSPFLSKQTIEELNELSLTNASKVLITRRSELAKLTEDLVNDLDVYVLKDFIVEGEGALSGENETNEVAQHQDIHAKIYARTKYNEHSIYLGSANCSNNAFHGNVEFLLKLEYQKYGFRISDLLEELFGKDETENPFEKMEQLPVVSEGEKEVKDILEKAIKQLCRTNAHGVISKEEEHYTLHMSFESIPSDVTFKIGPLLSKKDLPLEEETIFQKLGILELGQFYRIIAEKDGEIVQRIIKITTEGIPAERDHEVFRSIINDKYTFLRYVAFLLSDDFLLSALEQIENKKNGTGKWDSSMFDYPVLYENMLKAASRSPDKLHDVDKVMSFIKDVEIIPEEFKSLYKTFIGAAKKVRK
jgi:hypothetical protein